VIHALLNALGNPQDHLPPVFHVAGTNGKGSTCAYLRAMLEAQGLRVHSATKPHLVRYNERIRIAGHLIEDDALAAILAEVLDAAESLPEGYGPSFFEVTTAAIFLAFSRTPADACVIEVGLGGRLDATNVFKTPTVTGIATLGIDHEAFLLSPEEGTPPSPSPASPLKRPGSRARARRWSPSPIPRRPRPKCAASPARSAPLAMRGEGWDAAIGNVIAYRDAWGDMTLPLPTLVGLHQAENAALAVAMIRHQKAVHVTPQAMAKGIREARWPARLQRLGKGPLTELAGEREVWLDGGHNPDAGTAIARHFAPHAPVHLILGMLANKDPAALLGPLAPSLRSVSVVPAPGHDAHTPEDFAAHTDLPVAAFGDVAQALAALPPEGTC
jgi:dihydrofolate synthase/folylpolyglutamate synthase